MNCREWEERIALHAGGDLPPHEALATEGHLRECAGCREFEVELREHAAWMRAAHQELPAAADFAAVRAGVWERLERRRPFVWWPVWAGGLAALGAMVLLSLDSRRTEAPKPAPQAVIAKAPAMTAQSPPPQPAPRRHWAHTGRQKLPSQPLLVKLITDDPDVVIYWIVDPKGD